MKKNNNEKGIAVALVMLILALTTLAAMGMVAQSRMDTKTNRALNNYEKMFNLADAGAIRAFNQIQTIESVGYSGESAYTTVETEAPATIGQWKSKIAIKGYSTDPQDTPGWELGQDSGYHVQFWIGEGSGSRLSVGALPEATVNIAAIKLARN